MGYAFCRFFSLFVRRGFKKDYQQHNEVREERFLVCGGSLKWVRGVGLHEIEEAITRNCT